MDIWRELVTKYMYWLVFVQTVLITSGTTLLLEIGPSFVTGGVVRANFFAVLVTQVVRPA